MPQLTGDRLATAGSAPGRRRLVFLPLPAAENSRRQLKRLILRTNLAAGEAKSLENQHETNTLPNM